LGWNKWVIQSAEGEFLMHTMPVASMMEPMMKGDMSMIFYHSLKIRKTMDI